MLPFVDRMHRIAAAYDRAPMFDASAVDCWRALADDSLTRAAELRTRFEVIETDDPEPYPDAPAMFADQSRGRFVVSRANSAHPLWTVEENVAFRIVHDCAGHFVSGGHFDWHGENLACAAHEPLLSASAGRALFTECIAQTAYCNAYGHFGPQKVVLL